MQTITLVVSSAPYGSQRPHTAFRLAAALLLATETPRVQVFLVSDGVVAAKRGQKPPEGSYNLERTLAQLMANGVAVRLCVTCCEERGISQGEVVEGAVIGTMVGVAEAVLASDKVLSF